MPVLTSGEPVDAGTVLFKCNACGHLGDATLDATPGRAPALECPRCGTATWL